MSFLLISAVLAICIILIAQIVATHFPSADYDCRGADAYMGEAEEWKDIYFSKEWRWVQLKMRWEPFAYWRSRPHSGRFIQIGEDGIRHTWTPPLNLPSYENEIFMFGGSTTWGAGVRDFGTIPSNIARILDASRIHARVTNFAQIGYVSTQELIALVRQLQVKRIPTSVIFYDGYNDVMSALLNGRAGVAYHEGHREKEFLLHKRPFDLILSSIRSLALYQYLFDTNDRTRTEPGEEEGERLAEEISTVVEATFRMIVALGKEYGFNAHYFWQPTIFDKQAVTDYERSQRELIEFSRKTFVGVMKKLRQNRYISESSNFIFMNDLFSGSERSYFIDWSHLSEGGNELAASRIIHHLMPSLRSSL